MIEGIHHLNCIVRDLASAVPAWERVLGRPVTATDKLDARGVDIARFDLGNIWLILVAPNRPGTKAAQHLARHGEGFFLVSLQTDSLAGEIARLGDAAFDGPVRAGLDDWLVRDVAEQAGLGVQVQFVESGG